MTSRTARQRREPRPNDALAPEMERCRRCAERCDAKVSSQLAAPDRLRSTAQISSVHPLAERCAAVCGGWGERNGARLVR